MGPDGAAEVEIIDVEDTILADPVPAVPLVEVGAVNVEDTILADPVPAVPLVEVDTVDAVFWYILSLLGPPQSAFWSPLHVIEHPVTSGVLPATRAEPVLS